jgi:hypothetical protein
MDQVGEIETSAPEAFLPTAMNCWVALISMETSGVTMMLASASGGGAVGEEAHAADSRPATTTVRASRAVRPGGESARKIRSFMGVFIGTPPAVAGVDNVRDRRVAIRY